METPTAERLETLREELKLGTARMHTRAMYHSVARMNAAILAGDQEAHRVELIRQARLRELRGL